MSQDNNKFFEDFMKMAGSAMNTAINSASDMKNQFEKSVDNQIDKFLGKRNFIQREEFEVLKDMLTQAIEENKKLQSRVSELENKSGK